MKIFGISNRQEGDQLIKAENGYTVECISTNDQTNVDQRGAVASQTTIHEKISPWICCWQLTKLIIICILVSTILFSLAATVCLKQIIHDPSLAHEKNYNYKMLQCSQLAKLYWKNFNSTTSADDDPLLFEPIA